MTTTLLCIGDIHLGRRPAGLPDQLGRIRDELTPAAAWKTALASAIELEVDAVLLSGDVVESEEDFFEAFGLLDAGVRELLDRDIPVFAVAGNHDVEVLPRLADEIEGFHLLGRGGTWERRTLRREGEEILTILGWSFPGRTVERSPLADLASTDASALPLIGLLHCDLDAAGSRYAPVRRSELQSSPADAWLLGHIHKPGLDAGPRPIGYLGSLVGLDAGERGLHGPWVVEVHAKGEVRARQLPLAPLRWEAIELDVESLGAPEELEGRIASALPELHESLRGAIERTRAVGCRVRLAGRTSWSGEIRRRAATLCAEDLIVPREGTTYFLDKIENATSPARDLRALSAGSDPPALLARKLILLQGPRDNPDRQLLLQRARARLQPILEERAWHYLDAQPPADETIARHLLEQGMVALEKLLAQRGEAL